MWMKNLAVKNFSVFGRKNLKTLVNSSPTTIQFKVLLFNVTVICKMMLFKLDCYWWGTCKLVPWYWKKCSCQRQWTFLIKCSHKTDTHAHSQCFVFQLYFVVFQSHFSGCRKFLLVVLSWHHVLFLFSYTYRYKGRYPLGQYASWILAFSSKDYRPFQRCFDLLHKHIERSKHTGLIIFITRHFY